MSYCAQQIEFGHERLEEACTITVSGHDDGPLTIPLTISLSQPSEKLLGFLSYKDYCIRFIRFANRPAALDFRHRGLSGPLILREVWNVEFAFMNLQMPQPGDEVRCSKYLQVNNPE